MSVVTPPAYFESLLDTPFLLLALNKLPLQLSAVKIARHSTPEHPSFSLHFQGPREPALEQQTYAMQMQDGAVMDIFIVPIASDARGMQYEAVFN